MAAAEMLVQYQKSNNMFCAQMKVKKGYRTV